MQTITLDNEWIETAKLFGDVEMVVQDALRNYSIDQCKARIKKAVSKQKKYFEKYGFEYHHFKNDIQINKDFLKEIERKNPLWEEDAMEWEYWVEEEETWRKRLEAISKRQKK